MMDDERTDKPEDTEGHAFGGGARVPRAEEEDTEGHGLGLRRAEEEDTEGHGLGLRRAEEEDDTEGHKSNLK